MDKPRTPPDPELLDLFALMVLQSPVLTQSFEGMIRESGETHGQYLARKCYWLARLLLSERERLKQEPKRDMNNDKGESHDPDRDKRWGAR